MTAHQGARRPALALSLMGLVLLAAAAVPARAASLKDPTPADPTPVETPARTPSWTGSYFGGHLGYLWHEGSFNGAFAQFNSTSSSGYAFGLHMGAQAQQGPFVSGIELDYSRPDADDTDRRFAALSSLDFKTDMKELASLRARIGIAHGDALVYLTAGAGWMSSSFSLVTSDGVTARTSGTHDAGWVYGGGIDWRLNQKASLRTEVLHYAFDKKFVTSAGDTVNVDLGTTIVRTGFSVHF